MIIVLTSEDRSVPLEPIRDIEFEFPTEATFIEEQKEYVKQLVSARIEIEEDFEK